MTQPLQNPFKPGAGHMPPYLAGRENEKDMFIKVLKQNVVLENLIITGLRGTGKTVLLETLKPIAQNNGWYWMGTDLSESVCVSEMNMATRILTDIAIVTSGIKITVPTEPGIGFTADDKKNSEQKTLDYNFLASLFDSQPGLISDKLKYILEFVWSIIGQIEGLKGVVFAYDESQNLSDHSEKEQFPLSVLLDVFQSIQRKGIPFMLVLAGLPTLFSKLVDVRTYSERMFKIMELGNLNKEESAEAIQKPIQQKGSPITFNDNSVKIIVRESGGYPYFIQYICRECFDTFLLQIERGDGKGTVPMNEITAKLDTDFFSARRMRASDRERELLHVMATLDGNEKELSVQDILEKMPTIMSKPFSSSQTSQYLSKLIDKGLVYKSRYGKYSFAVPLMGNFINRWYTNYSKNSQ